MGHDLAHNEVGVPCGALLQAHRLGGVVLQEHVRIDGLDHLIHLLFKDDTTHVLGSLEREASLSKKRK